MKWILIAGLIIYWPISAAGKVDENKSVVCDQYIEMIENNLKEALTLEVALRENKGKTKEQLEIKIELMNAINVNKENGKRIRKAFETCKDNVK
jgi:hypothetical protein